MVGMKTPAPPSRSLQALRELTPARVGLGRAGASMPTQGAVSSKPSMPTDALLAFTLDHARVRDAVHGAFDTSHLVEGLSGLGLAPVLISSQARNRRDYLRRPDLGRMLDPDSRGLLADRGAGRCQLAIVIGDGLSPAAVNVHAIELVRNLASRLKETGVQIGRTVVASGARVALGDETVRSSARAWCLC